MRSPGTSTLVPLVEVQRTSVPGAERTRFMSTRPKTLLDHLGVGLFDKTSHPSERLAPPITQLRDSRIDQLRGRVSSFSVFRAALPLLHGGYRFLHGCTKFPLN